MVVVSDVMKGITAIEAVIILVLGVITLIAILGIFMGTWSPAKAGVSLQAATQASCQQVNPSFCKGLYPNWPDAGFAHSDMFAARMPVYNFNANKDAAGLLNEHVTDGTFKTSAGNDNLEALCQYYYGCAQAGTTDATWTTWTRCCLVNVCGCPMY